MKHERLTGDGGIGLLEPPPLATPTYGYATPSPNERTSPVMAWNEWDPLEEVIVGRLEGATIPSNHVTVTFNLPRAAVPFYRFAAGWQYPKWMKKLAQKELDGFIRILEGEGIAVRRPDIVNFSRSYRSPDWSSRGFLRCLSTRRLHRHRR